MEAALASFRAVATAHQTKIAKDTLKMSDIGARIMGGMSKEEARAHLTRQGWTPTRIARLEAGK